MGLRFRRRIKILPGVHLNLSRSGISTSVGVRGASMTFGKQGTFVNSGIPGTGISYRSRVSPEPRPPNDIVLQSDTAPNATQFNHHLHWWKVLLFFGTMVLAGEAN